MKRWLIAIIFLVSIGLASAQLADSPWSKWRGNMKNTGLSPHDTSHIDGTIKWVFESDKGMESSPAIGADGTIYIGSHQNVLYAINPDGSEKWHFQVGDGPVYSQSGTAKYSGTKGILSSPAVAKDGTIYFTSQSDLLFALNPDGTEKWRYEIDLSIDIWNSPAIGKDGTVYVGSHDDFRGKLYALSPDGKLLWNYSTRGDICSSAAVGDDGTIYIGSGDKHLHAITPKGKRKWAFEFEDFADSSPAIGKDGTIYVGSTRAGKLYAVSSDGKEKWWIQLGPSIDVWSSPAIGADGTIYIGGDDKNLYAVSPEGKVKWLYALPDEGGCSPAIGADGTIYMGSKDLYGSDFFAIYPHGTEKWRANVKGWASSPAIGKDTIYVGSWSGLYAIGSAEDIEPEIPETEPSQGNLTVEYKEYDDKPNLFVKIMNFFKGLFK